jgi:hypothetical protein
MSVFSVGECQQGKWTRRERRISVAMTMTMKGNLVYFYLGLSECSFMQHAMVSMIPQSFFQTFTLQRAIGLGNNGHMFTT